MKKQKIKMKHNCAIGITNNWRKMHHYPLSKKYKNCITFPCNMLQERGICDFSLRWCNIMHMWCSDMDEEDIKNAGCYGECYNCDNCKDVTRYWIPNM